MFYSITCCTTLFTSILTQTLQYYQGAAISVFTAQSSNLAGGKVVSLAADGSVQNGAGTSIYKNIVDVATSCPKYLSMDAMLGDAYLISSTNSFTDSTLTKTTLSVVTVGATTPDQGVIPNVPKVVDNPIVEVLTLNSDSGLFVGLCQDIDPDVATDFIVAGTVDKTNKYAISDLIKSPQYGGNYSVEPSITRLSDTEFAIAYYGDDDVKTRYGM